MDRAMNRSARIQHAKAADGVARADRQIRLYLLLVKCLCNFLSGEEQGGEGKSCPNQSGAGW